MACAGREADQALMRRLASVLAFLLLIFFARDASAHASLASSEPRDGAVVAKAPEKVALHFSESVTAGAVNLIDATGSLRKDAVVDAGGEAITVTLPPDLPRGTQILSYRVISQDGHPVSGAVTFSIGAPTENKVPAEENGDIGALIWLARIGLYLGLFAGIGGVVFIHWIARERVATRLIGAALMVGIVGAAASLGLQGLDVLGLPLSGISGLAPWKIALGTSLGPSLLIAIAALVMAFVALRGHVRSPSRALSALALAGVGLCLAASGHAATAPPQALTRPAVFLHGIGVAFWIGALAPLASLLLIQKQAALPVVNRFSVAAVPVVGLVALTGIALAVVQLESLGALTNTAYGIVLLTKLVL